MIIGTLPASRIARPVRAEMHTAIRTRLFLAVPNQMSLANREANELPRLMGRAGDGPVGRRFVADYWRGRLVYKRRV